MINTEASRTISDFFRDVVSKIDNTRRKLSQTVFTQYLAVTSAILIGSFVLFASLLAGLLSDRWQNDKQKQLSDNLSSLSEWVARRVYPIFEADINTFAFYILGGDERTLRSTVSNLSDSLNADIFLIDTSGNVVLSSSADHIDIRKITKEFTLDSLTVALGGSQGDFRDRDTLNGAYESERYIVGVPIISKNSVGRDVAIGMLLATTPANSVEDFQHSTVSFLGIAVALASLVSIVAVSVITYQQVKPLREMARAAQKYAVGDFSVRVPVTSETEVGQLTSAFNNMATSLAAGENMRRSFVANVSHELKTPMTTISGFVDGILDGTIPGDKHAQYLTTVSNETKRLARLVRSMLDLSRIDSGEMKLKKNRFDLSQTVLDTLFSFEQKIDEKKIDIRGLDNLRNLLVYGDSDLIHQVVYNLFENAVKFADVGGFISVKLYPHDKNAYVCIGNSGIGIPSEELPHIFERFYKTDKSRSFDKSGVGLGLFIVKTVLSLHGGGIEARSYGSDYCEFEFHIPIERSS